MIKDELILLFTSLYCGIIFAIVYDAIRIIRNLIKPHFIRVVIEDFIYWICVAYIFFSMLIKKKLRKFKMVSYIWNAFGNGSL